MPRLFQGSLGTVGQAGRARRGARSTRAATRSSGPTRSPHPPPGRPAGRVWRRLHGGDPNAPAYQLWLSAIGLQPENNRAFTLTYPWLGFRVGVIGDLKVEG